MVNPPTRAAALEGVVESPGRTQRRQWTQVGDRDAGFWRLNHEDLAALLARADLSWETVRVYLALADLTLGYGKAKDAVSLAQLAEMAGMSSVDEKGARYLHRAHVVRALKILARRGLYGHSSAAGQSMTRWVTWPPPPPAAKGAASPGSSTGAKGAAKGAASPGSSTGAKGAAKGAASPGSSTGAKGAAKGAASPGSSTLQDVQDVQEAKDTKKTKRIRGRRAAAPKMPLLLADADPPPAAASPKSAHADLVAYWTTCWKETHNATAYPFTRRDAAHLKALLAATGADLAAAKRVVDAYLACTDAWYIQRGHKLGLLVADLPRFVGGTDAGGAGSGRRSGEVPYRRAAEPLPRVPVKPAGERRA